MSGHFTTLRSKGLKTDELFQYVYVTTQSWSNDAKYYLVFAANSLKDVTLIVFYNVLGNRSLNHLNEKRYFVGFFGFFSLFFFSFFIFAYHLKTKKIYQIDCVTKQKRKTKSLTRKSFSFITWIILVLRLAHFGFGFSLPRINFSFF